MISYSALNTYGKSTLPSVEHWTPGSNSKIPKDPPKSIHTRRIDKVLTDDVLIDEYGGYRDRWESNLLYYPRGQNVMGKMDYGAYGTTSGGTNNQSNNLNSIQVGARGGGAKLPLRINRDGDFRPPLIRQEDLLPLSRQPRPNTFIEGTKERRIKQVDANAEKMIERAVNEKLRKISMQTHKKQEKQAIDASQRQNVKVKVKFFDVVPMSVPKTNTKNKKQNFALDSSKFMKNNISTEAFTTKQPRAQKQNTVELGEAQYIQQSTHARDVRGNKQPRVQKQNAVALGEAQYIQQSIRAKNVSGNKQPRAQKQNIVELGEAQYIQQSTHARDVRGNKQPRAQKQNAVALGEAQYIQQSIRAKNVSGNKQPRAQKQNIVELGEAQYTKEQTSGQVSGVNQSSKQVSRDMKMHGTEKKTRQMKEINPTKVELARVMKVDKPSVLNDKARVNIERELKHKTPLHSIAPSFIKASDISGGVSREEQKLGLKKKIGELAGRTIIA